MLCAFDQPRLFFFYLFSARGCPHIAHGGRFSGSSDAFTVLQSDQQLAKCVDSFFKDQFPLSLPEY